MVQTKLHWCVKRGGCSCCKEMDAFKRTRPDVDTWPQTGHVSPLAPLHSGNHARSPPTPMTHVPSTTHASHPCLHILSPDLRVPTHNNRLLPPLHVAAATAYAMHRMISSWRLSRIMNVNLGHRI